MVVTGVDEPSLAASEAATRKQLAFYGSTPAYRPVLELHGWGDLQKDLNTLSKRGDWDDMADLIDDEMLHTFAVVGELDTIAAEDPGPLRRPRRPVQRLRPLGHQPRALGRGAGRLPVLTPPPAGALAYRTRPAWSPANVAAPPAWPRKRTTSRASATSASRSAPSISSRSSRTGPRAGRVQVPDHPAAHQADRPEDPVGGHHRAVRPDERRPRRPPVQDGIERPEQPGTAVGRRRRGG